MTDRGILSFIWSHRTNRLIVLADILMFILALTIKFFFWDKLTLIPFIFFGTFIPFGLLWINILPFTFHSEWLKINNDYKDGFELKKDVRVYIKNFWPWTELAKIKNTLRSLQIPFYNFNRADILESKDVIIIYGKNEGLFGAIGNTRRTRPFGISLSGHKIEKSQLYQVDLISKNESKEFSELVFIDKLYGKAEPITIKIYKDGDENAR